MDRQLKQTALPCRESTAAEAAAIRATCDAAVMLSRVHMTHPDRFDRCRYPRCSCHGQVAALRGRAEAEEHERKPWCTAIHPGCDWPDCPCDIP